ncbi:MAG: response regulator [Bacillota bacterium]
MAPRVLIVDDDTMVRMSVAAYLEDEGFDVHSATSAAEALRMLETEPLELAIVDLRLCDMDGEQFILKAHAIKPDMRFLIHTGCMLYQLTPALVQIGMTEVDVVYKPMRLQTLANHIRRVTTPNPPTRD